MLNSLKPLLSSRTIVLVSIGLLIVFLSLSFIVWMQAERRSALWRIVRQCVADQEQYQRPNPCVRVNLAGGERDGYVLFKDRIGKAQFLLIPTRRLHGIESTDIVNNGVPNYWQSAWESRTYVFQRVGRELPRDAVGMAINSSVSRSQDQLHIHLDCLQPTVRSLIGNHLDQIREAWSRLNFDLQGHRYWAMRVDSRDLQQVNPFRLLAKRVETSRDMELQTLVIIGTRFPDGHDGFVLLSDTANLVNHDLAHGEDLLDHTCAIAS